MLKEKKASHREHLPILPPVPGGTESLEGLGSFIDNLLGDGRIRRAAKDSLNRMIQSGNGDSNSPSEGAEPTPTSPPPPVPGGNESVTKGEDPPGENR
jgi:hypothetical protein